jgi:hypothetical protein
MRATAYLTILIGIMLFGISALFADSVSDNTAAENFYWNGVRWLDSAICDSLIEEGFKVNANTDEIVKLFLENLDDELWDLDEDAYYGDMTDEEYGEYFNDLENGFVDLIEFLQGYKFKVHNKDDFLGNVNDQGMTRLKDKIEELIPELK